MEKFELDERLARDTSAVSTIGLCQLRLMNDSRWPWLILVPQRLGSSEIFDLSPLDQDMLGLETMMVARALKQVTACTKVNIASIGNIVRQLHVHVIGRDEGDANWPGPVWGFGTAVAYDTDKKDNFIKSVLEALSA